MFSIVLLLIFRDSELLFGSLPKNLSRPHKATINATDRKGMIPIAIQKGFNDIFISFTLLITRDCVGVCSFKTKTNYDEIKNHELAKIRIVSYSRVWHLLLSDFVLLRLRLKDALSS